MGPMKRDVLRDDIQSVEAKKMTPIHSNTGNQ